MTSNRLSSNMEDYLESIAILKHEKGIARVKDISRMMGVKTPSVTGALNSLADMKLIVHERYGHVDLTAEGEKLAKGIKKRHDMLVKFLNKVLKIDKTIARRDACLMEHAISQVTFEKLTKFIDFIENSPHGDRPRWLQHFDDYFKTGKRTKCRVKS